MIAAQLLLHSQSQNSWHWHSLALQKCGILTSFHEAHMTSVRKQGWSENYGKVLPYIYQYTCLWLGFCLLSSHCDDLALLLPVTNVSTRALCYPSVLPKDVCFNNSPFFLLNFKFSHSVGWFPSICKHTVMSVLFLGGYLGGSVG